MQAKHTPGPWAVNGSTISSAPTDAAPTGYALAHVLNPYAGATGAAARVDANAALIAAAPDLLENLRQLADLLESIGHDCTPAREVIARATGA